MPSLINFDAFRLRWLSKSTTKPPNEDDSDPSLEGVQRRVNFHIGTPKKTRQHPDRPRNVQKSLPQIPAVSVSKPLHNEVVNEKSSILEQSVETTEKLVGLLRSNTNANIHKPSPPTTKPPPDMKPSLIRRMTSKLRITVPASSHLESSPPCPTHKPADVKHSSRPPRSPHATLHHSPTLPNSFASRENREAALRERGLRPPMKDLSEQEREADKRLAPIPAPDKGQDGYSAAAKIKEEWMSINRSYEMRTSDSVYPRQLPSLSALASGVSLLSHSASSLPRSSTCDSDCSRAELNAEMPFGARSSTSGSVPPLSPTSHLEVLEEEPTEHVLSTPPPPHHVQPPIIISTPVENSFAPDHAVLVESPISCTFSTYLAPPGSPSQPHISAPVIPDKANLCSPSPAPASRRRTTDPNIRRRSSVGTHSSRLGTNSLTNLRCSLTGSLRYSGSSADLSSNSSQPSSPRVAIMPTMHDRGSILLETKSIQDPESRRLSELAFLD